MSKTQSEVKPNLFSRFGHWLSHTTLQLLVGSKKAVLPVLTGPARGLWFHHTNINKTSEVASHHDSLKALSLICQKGWTIWDCASEEGVSTVLFSKFVGIDGLVVCFEAKREVFLRTYENATLNGCNNILFHFAEVGEPAKKHAFLPPVCARQMSLDEAYQDSELPIPHLIRLDLSTNGISILNYGDRMIREQRPILVINKYGPSDRDWVVKFAEEHGYSLQSLENGTIWQEAVELSGPILCSPAV